MRKNSKFWKQDILELADLKETKFWNLSLDINTCQTAKLWNFAMGIRLLANIDSSLGTVSYTHLTLPTIYSV